MKKKNLNFKNLLISKDRITTLNSIRGGDGETGLPISDPRVCQPGDKDYGLGLDRRPTIMGVNCLMTVQTCVNETQSPDCQSGVCDTMVTCIIDTSAVHTLVWNC